MARATHITGLLLVIARTLRRGCGRCVKWQGVWLVCGDNSIVSRWRREAHFMAWSPVGSIRQCSCKESHVYVTHVFDLLCGIIWGRQEPRPSPSLAILPASQAYSVSSIHRLLPIFFSAFSMPVFHMLPPCLSRPRSSQWGGGGGGSSA